MLINEKNEDGYIIGYIEYQHVAQSGLPKYKGEYLWIHDLWIHEKFKGRKMLLKLVKMMLVNAPSAQYGYWRRGKYNGRISRLYKRSEFKRLLENKEI